MVSSFIWNCNTLVVDSRKKTSVWIAGCQQCGNWPSEEARPSASKQCYVEAWLVRTPKNALNFASSIPHRSPPLLYYHLQITFLLANCIHTWCFVWRQVTNHIFPKMLKCWNLTQSSLLWIFKCVSGEVWICIVRLGLKWKHFDDLFFASILLQRSAPIFLYEHAFEVFLLLNAIWWANSLRKWQT